MNPSPGVPPSVMSPTPCLIGGGLGCGTSFGGGFNIQHNPHIRIGRRPRHRPVFPVAYPVYYPYAYPMLYEDQAQPPPVTVEINNEIPGPTVFERNWREGQRDGRVPAGDDSRYGTHYLDERERREASAPQPAPEPLEIVSTMLIYRDGHKREVRNYAIVGETLYEIGGLTAHKIPLAELDLEATRRENDERGVQFSMPEGPRGQ